VIDSAARDALSAYLEQQADRILFQASTEHTPAGGCFVPPTVIELDSPRDLSREIFGPVLHVVRYQATAIDALVDAINATGFGLTLGIHSRVDALARHIARRARVGNVYVNRNMIGAVVGVQPFGGMGLSGTGPKAGGPNYLPRFMAEQTITTNTAAVGGNTTLLTLAEGSQIDHPRD
jgi:RHH-type proline utilization regulon transcriptional repressor/proline dehydrogenase/delta 1-pyrroline-5-carboxylate dehydrogenase